jgi:hypothetical protein
MRSPVTVFIILKMCSLGIDQWRENTSKIAHTLFSVCGFFFKMLAGFQNWLYYHLPTPLSV